MTSVANDKTVYILGEPQASLTEKECPTEDKTGNSTLYAMLIICMMHC